MTINFKVLGAGLLAVAPLLKDLAPAQSIWWLGIACAVCGPVFMSIQLSAAKTKPRRRRKPKRKTKP